MAHGDTEGTKQGQNVHRQKIQQARAPHVCEKDVLLYRPFCGSLTESVLLLRCLLAKESLTAVVLCLFSLTLMAGKVSRSAHSQDTTGTATCSASADMSVARFMVSLGVEPFDDNV